MYPDLLAIFGVSLYGLTFERLLWGALIALMLWGIVSSAIIYRRGRRTEGLVQGGIVALLLLRLVYQFWASFEPNYALVFEKPVVLHSYAFMILIGMAAGIGSAAVMGKMRGYAVVDIVRLCLILVLTGFVGARVMHVLVEGSSYYNACFNPELLGLTASDCTRVFRVSEGGLVFYGGVIAGVITLAYFVWRRRRKGERVFALELGDILASSLAVTHAFGRLGCLAAGCCWGAVTTGTCGLHYGEGAFAYEDLMHDPAYVPGLLESAHTPLMHATQIYEALGEFALFGLLWLLFIKKATRGKMVAVWFMAYGLLRFVVEIMRGDSVRGHLFESVHPTINEWFSLTPDHVTFLSTSQAIALAMMAVGLITFCLVHLTRKKVSMASAEPSALVMDDLDA